MYSHVCRTLTGDRSSQHEPKDVVCSATCHRYHSAHAECKAFRTSQRYHAQLFPGSSPAFTHLHVLARNYARLTAQNVQSGECCSCASDEGVANKGCSCCQAHQKPGQPISAPCQCTADCCCCPEPTKQEHPLRSRSGRQTVTTAGTDLLHNEVGV